MKLAEMFEKMRRKGKPIRVILLKARQWGGSTLTQIYMAWIQIMWVKSWNSIIVGHQGDSAAEVKDMYVKLIQALPDFLFYDDGEKYDEGQPKIKGGGTTNISMIPARNCKIKTATAMNPEGARGGDSAMAHCTEVAFWPQTEKMDPQKQVKSSCSGVLFKPYTMIVYESTANGQNFFKDEWDRANKIDEHGDKESAFYPLFVAWWEIEQYTMDPDNIFEWACILISRREDNINNWNYLYWLWTIGATLRGIYWYWQKMREYKDDPFIACDVIAGLPGEGEREWEESYAFLSRVRFAAMHVFPFSPRPGTALYKARDRVEERIRDERAEMLRKLSAEMGREYLSRQIGKETEVLAEEGDEGTTGNYLKARIILPEGRALVKGLIYRGRVTGVDPVTVEVSSLA